MGFKVYLGGLDTWLTLRNLAMATQVGNPYQVDVDASRAGRVFTAIAAPLIGSKIAHSVMDFPTGIG